jgi:acyl dehydratase
MKKVWGAEEISKAKADKSIRDKIKAEFERKMDLGKPMYYSLDTDDFWRKLVRTTVTEESIKTFCDGIGDVNPLYRSKDYAKNTIYGEIIAPPTYLNAITSFNVQGVTGMTFDFQLAGFYAGASVEWFKTIRLGDKFNVVEVPTKVVDLTRENTGVQFLTTTDKIYKNQNDEVVAVVGATVMSILTTPRREQKLVEPKMRHFSIEEVEEWHNLMEKEEIRGTEPRFWEDVNVGDKIPSTHHVFDMMETAAWMVGTGSGGSWRFTMGRRGLGDKDMWKRMADPESGLPERGGLHMTDSGAKRSGSPRANALAVQLGCWLSSMLTNWMGDVGFLKKLSFQVRRSLYRDSLALCTGEVVGKSVENGEHRVELKIELEDHNGDKVIPNGSAVVILPSRKLENWQSLVTLPPRPPL